MQGMKTPELLDEICRRIAEGETLRSICRDLHTPHWTTVYDWIKEDEAFALRIAQARELGFEAIAEEALAIADTPQQGEEREESESGVKVKKGDMLGHRKLQVETRLKLLAKWSPKKYGDKQQIEHSGKLSLESLVAGEDGDG